MTEPTPRQLAILIAYIEAGGSRQAAARLKCHPGTVRAVLSEVQEVLGAANSAQAFAIAVRDGLIRMSDMHLPEAA